MTEKTKQVTTANKEISKLPDLIPRKTLAKYTSVKDLARMSEAYFNHCDQNKEPYTVSGLAYYLGFQSRESLIDYQEKHKFGFAVKRAKLRIQGQLEKWLYIPGRPTIGLIFSLKNNFGWKDQQEIKQSGSIDIRVIAIPARKEENENIDISEAVILQPLEELPEKRINKTGKVAKARLKEVDSAQVQ